MTVDGEIGIIVSPLGGERRCTFGRRFGQILRKGVRRVTLTFHIGEYTVTIKVWKRKNRHSAK